MEYVTSIPSDVTSSRISESLSNEMDEIRDDVTVQSIASAVYMLRDEDFPTDIITHKYVQPEKSYHTTQHLYSRSLLFRFVIIFCITLYICSISGFIISNTLTCMDRTALEIVILFSLTFIISLVFVLPISNWIYAAIVKFYR